MSRPVLLIIAGNEYRVATLPGATSEVVRLRRLSGAQGSNNKTKSQHMRSFRHTYDKIPREKKSAACLRHPQAFDSSRSTVVANELLVDIRQN